MTKKKEYCDWFRGICEFDPYEFQWRFVERLPSIIKIPTGCGKTATVVLGWLWRRICSGNSEWKKNTPRRLVYCLPMRVLVEQTKNAVSQWMEKLGLEEQISIEVLMGGEDIEDWELHPEREAILIGAQDMLLSRALNRGYAMSRYRWPMTFGLLNNDCLWVLDEVQLMDTGLATATQLHAFRKQIKTLGTVHTVWMSATLDKQWLNTVDFNLKSLDEPLTLNHKDFNDSQLCKRYKAVKRLSKCNAKMGDAKSIAQEIVKNP